MDIQQIFTQIDISQVFIQSEYFLRVAIAALCGGLIGYERESRLKTAGIRTHVIVALSASLMMIVSKYGFADVLSLYNIDYDPSRVASGIVSAIGFLGAGVIFTNRNMVNGITTAAGVWATVGVGMAIGGGMYPIGICTTLLIIFIQFLLHRDFKWIKKPTVEHIVFEITTPEQSIEDICSSLIDQGFEVLSTKIKRLGANKIEVSLSVKLPPDYTLENIDKLLHLHESIKSIGL